MNNKRRNRKGFTIVELSIVIAVIAILAAVMIPVFGNMIDKANKSNAISEAKNLYTEYVARVDYVAGDNAQAVVWVKTSKGYFVKVENGSVTSKDTEIDKETPTGDHILLISKNGGNIVKDCVGDCDAVTADPTANPAVEAKNCSVSGKAAE